MSSIYKSFFIFSLLLIFSMTTVYAQALQNGFFSVNKFKATTEARLVTDKGGYAKGDSVVIYGEGFGSFEDVSLSVESYSDALQQNIVVMQWNVFSEKGGAFTASIPFDSLSSDSGRYTIKAFGSGTKTSAETTIENVILAASANIDQCANGGVGNPVEPCSGTGWVNGNVNQSKGHWVEGQSAAYRISLTGFTVGSTGNSVTIGYDTTKGGKHALDYLTSFDRTETLAMGNNPCSGIAGCSLGTFTTAPIPIDPKVTAGFDQIPGNGDDITQVPGVFTLFGGTITNVSSYTYTGSYAGDSHTSITITFTAGSTNMVLAWGGHIGTRVDWGAGNSAINISGSPYHMGQDSCSFGCGAMDRGLSATAVALLSKLVIFVNVAPESSWVFNFNASGPGLSNFSLVDDGTNTNNSISFNVPLLANQTGALSVTDNLGTNGQYDLTSIVCVVPANSTSTTSQNLPIGNLGVNLAYGETVTCTFNLSIVTAANVSAAGRVMDAYGNGIARTSVTIQNTATGETRTILTNSFGYYRFEDLPAGSVYIISAYNRRYQFENPSQLLQLNDAVENINFVASLE